MMTPARLRALLVGATAAALLAGSPLTLAVDHGRYDEPDYGLMVADFLVVRPLGLGATICGTAFWVVSLPFSALGGNVDEAAEELIRKPARFTFARPLGDM